MKHVREDLPDVQSRRPEVSATVAAIVDRMTDKDLGRRYPDAATVVYELENALAVEAARSGQATGEATAVLRTLPESARRRLPLRMRWRVPLVGLLLVVAIGAVAAGFLIKEARDNTVRGTGVGTVRPEPNTRIVSVSNTSAKDYDPAGDGSEHPRDTPLAVDKDPETAWDTETYMAGDLQKEGVGLYVDAKPRTRSRRIVIETPKAGWEADVYVAPAGSVPESLEGWTRVGGGTVSKREQRFSLDTDDRRYRYFLVWITKLPPGEQRVEISDVSILAPER
jgi:serine/threonine-protein kinase